MSVRLPVFCVFASMLVLLGGWASRAEAAAINISVPTNWSSIVSGSGGGGQPDVTDTITVDGASANLNVDVTNGVCASIVLGGTFNGSLTFQSITSQVTIGGTLTLGSGSGTGMLDMTNAGTLIVQQLAVGGGGHTFVAGTTGT